MNNQINPQPDNPINPVDQTPYSPPPSPDPIQPPITPPIEGSKPNRLVLILSILFIIALAAAGFFGFKYYQSNQEPAATEQPTPSPSEVLTKEDTPDPTANWKTYIDPTHNFTLKYPPNYSVSGELASSLQAWQAGKGISITDPNNLANPLIFIEAVFDGYGPFFPTGNLEASIVNDQLNITLTKLTDQDYQQLATNGNIIEGTELFMSEIIEHDGVPFQFRISHSDKSNTILEQELLQILSTIQFIESTETVMGIQTNTCCSCPTKIPVSQLGTDGWVKYEPGKNYITELPEACNKAACAPCPPPTEN